MTTQTLAAQAYDQERNEILRKIYQEGISASLSGIEHFPVEWKDLPEKERQSWINFFEKNEEKS